MDEAFQAGRVSDEIFPGWKVPTYYEAQQKADDVIRSQFERARREYGGLKPFHKSLEVAPISVRLVGGQSLYVSLSQG